MNTRLSLLTLASVLAMACSSSSGGDGTGGAANMPPGNTGGNNGPMTAGVLGPDPAPDSTDHPQDVTDPAPNATDPAPSATDPAPNATDLPVGVGGITAPGSVGGGDLAGADCTTLCASISQSCPAPQELLDACAEECRDAMEHGCYAEMGAAIACAAAAACTATSADGIAEACSQAFDAVDCNGSVVQPGQGEGGQPSVPAGGSGCAGLQACCNGLAEGATECNQIASLGNEPACTSTLQIYQASAVCP